LSNGEGGGVSFCHHGHDGHTHSHGPRAAAFAGMGNLYTPAYGHPDKSMDQMMDVVQQPKKRSHMDDSSSWDIVKATQFGILERCKELVEAGYDIRQPDKENVTLLHWAAINNRTELVKYYISKGAIIDQLGGDLNSTPLHWAIRQGHLPMVIQLMRYGADPSISDGEGYRALHLAILFQHMAIAAYLMAKGQEVDGPDCNGQTPLMLAAQKIIGPEPTNFLIKNNASVSAVDKVNRNTPLHCAVLAGNVDAAHVLLEAGASVEAENIKGHTPIDLAHQVHSPLLIHILNHVKQERIRSNSRCARIVNRYRAFLHLLYCIAVFGSVGAIFDLDSESWLLKAILLACVIGVSQLISRTFQSSNFQSLLPASALMASVFWMLVTWCLWFLPDILSSFTVQILFTLSATALLYYYIRTCRTDPGFIRTTEEKKKMNVVVLAEAGFLDPRVFCTSCMVRGTTISSSRFCSRCGCTADQGLWSAASALFGCSPWVLTIFLLSLYHTCWSTLVLMIQLYQIAFLGITSAEIPTLRFQQRKFRSSASLKQNPFNMGVLQNLVSFFQLRCCGFCKPVVTDWMQQQHPPHEEREHQIHGNVDE
uniref:Zinc finger DHHC-type palmitoyltransferase 13 n=1 Tax=Oryzias sinensis TaxID=183150 RepID=A0A8C7WNK6_9TELE